MTEGLATTIELRPSVGPEDQEFSFRVYASAREEELAPVPWSEAEKGAFLRQQFMAQDTDYRANHPGAEFLLILEKAEPVGRLYLDRSSDRVHVLDIALLPAHRGRGIGGGIVRGLQAEAAAADVPIDLYVEATNPARRLYARLGFLEVEKGPVYDLLEWRVSEPVAADSS